MAEGIFGAFTSAQKAGQQFGQDIQSKNILQQAYAGTTPEDVAADPLKQQSVLQQAAIMAGQKGLNSLSYSFNKQAGELSENVQKSQLDAIKNMQGQLGYSGQLLSALPADATTEDFNNVFANIKEPQAQMAIQSITRNPNFTSERKKELLTKLTETVDQNLKAQTLLGVEEERKARIDARDERILLSRIGAKRRNGDDLTPEEQDYADYGVLPGDKNRITTKGVETGAGTAGAPTAEGREYNVGNIRPPKGVTYEGQTGIDAKGFATFKPGPADDPNKYGNAAIQQDIGAKLKQGINTPKAFIEKYAPPKSKGGDNEDAITEAYVNNVAKALGIKPTDTIKDTPENRKILQEAIIKQEGVVSPKATATKEPVTADDKVVEQYDRKRGGGLTVKEWDTINPTAVQIGKEYKVKPTNVANATTAEKTQANNAYQVTKIAEDTSEYIKAHRNAVGTLAGIVKAVAGKTGNLEDNVSADPKYTGEIQELGKRLFALGLKDAGAVSGGRMNVFLEKQFANLYQQSQSPQTLLRIIKARQEESFNVLRDTYGADKEKLDKSKYKLGFADSADAYLKEGKGGKASADKPTVDINSFFFTPKNP